MKKFKRKFKHGTAKDKLLIILMLSLIAIFTLIIIFFGYVVMSAPDISEERLYKNNSTVLLDVNGNEFKRLGTENREKVSYDELPEVLIDAIVATEDSRFFQHNGIDIARFSKAVFGQILGHSDAGGGSTLTMQVSKNAATSTTSSGIQGLIRKFTDIYLSVFVFEKQYTKEQILEFYVNIPNLGSGAYGVEQASKVYFGKSVSELNLAEAALIAGLFQAPSAYNPYNYPEKAQSRRNTVLNLMYKHGYISKIECEAAKSVPVTSLLVGRDTSLSEYTGFIDTVVEEVVEKTGEDPYTTSMVIHTTMNPEKQQVINDLYAGKTYEWKNEYVQTGIAVVSVKDGSLVAVGAGRNKTAERSFNYATSASRHPGSTAKPVIDYGPAIEYLGWGTGQTIIDDKMTYSGGASIKNFDNGYKGIMTIKQALAQSRNIPALYTFMQTTNEQKYEFSTNLGWRPGVDANGTLLESDSIGGFEGVTPLESAAAYASFARGGTYIEPYSFTLIEYPDTGDTYERKPKKVQAMSEETAYMINVILKYAVTSGVIGAGSVSGTDIAAKTGTSTVDSSAKKALGIKKNIIGDSWEVAYSPDYAISTWYGYPTLDKDHYLTSSEGGTARKQITKILVKGIMEKNSTFKKPSGVVSAEIELETDPLQLASSNTPSELRSTEYFKKGTAPSTTSERFATLETPTNLTYTATTNTVTLNWNAIATPKAISTEYLTEYFNESKVYKKWADKYLQQRIDYNNSTFGSLGYRIYMTNSTGSYDLGFTTNTTFTYTTNLDSQTTFSVKASYQNFTSNMSSAATTVVTPNTTTTSSTTSESTSNTTVTQNVTVKFNKGTEISKNEYLPYYNNDKIKELFTVTCNEENVTDFTINKSDIVYLDKNENLYENPNTDFASKWRYYANYTLKINSGTCAGVTKSGKFDIVT